MPLRSNTSTSQRASWTSSGVSRERISSVRADDLARAVVRQPELLSTRVFPEDAGLFRQSMIDGLLLGLTRPASETSRICQGCKLLTIRGSS